LLTAIAKALTEELESEEGQKAAKAWQPYRLDLLSWLNAPETTPPVWPAAARHHTSHRMGSSACSELSGGGAALVPVLGAGLLPAGLRDTAGELRGDAAACR
jgi:hypothetical protein